MDGVTQAGRQRGREGRQIFLQPPQRGGQDKFVELQRLAAGRDGRDGLALAGLGLYRRHGLAKLDTAGLHGRLGHHVEDLLVRSRAEQVLWEQSASYENGDNQTVRSVDAN